QRVSIAMALIHRPKLVILDEATTALDVITQQQIISELNAIRKKYDITTIVISHDLSVISKLCNKVAVMYCGRILEFGNKSDIINAPKHPYTKALISSYPKFTDEKGSLSGIPGCLADMGKEIVGCVFKERCKYCTDICKNTNPQYEQIDDTHHICCHLWRKTI
ncbi:MAG: ABC transporter ATP-binding protein, partial [Oscillospiraceae bacterium]